MADSQQSPQQLPPQQEQQGQQEQQPSPSRIGKITNMGTRYLSRWVSWSGPPATASQPTSRSGSPKGSPRGSPRGTPMDVLGGMPISPQPPRPYQSRSRTSSKASNMSEATPCVYPLVPKLPVPPLGHTLTWYLKHLQCVVPPDEFAEVENIAKEFGKPGGLGEKLQEELIKRHDTMDNWVYQWWLEDMYMNVPSALPVNSNPGMVFPLQHFATQQDMASFAAKLVIAALEMKERIYIGDLDVDRCSARERHQPMCMAQYSRVFTSYRRPGIPRDKLISFADQTLANQHILVMHKNHMFRVDVVIEGIPLTSEELTKQVMRVLKEVEDYEGADPPALGIMTADNRRFWAQNRQILISDPTNLSNLTVIEGCTLVLCLDEPLSSRFNLTTRTSHKASLTKRQSSFTAGSAPQEQQKTMNSLRDEVNAGQQMIHGGGSAHNSANRWFDKTVQFVVTQDGWCGLCYEHSPAEGIVVIQLVEQVLHSLAEQANTESTSVEPMDERRDDESTKQETEIVEDELTLKKLEWSVTPVILRRIQESADNVDRLVEDLDFRILRYTGYGRNFIKQTKCSPDAFIQLALQLAYFRTQGQLTSTYESASIRRFRVGRVDVIRSNTPKALEWCEAMVLNGPASDRLSKFQAALETQTEIMVNNILGRGIDNHLLGLREVAKEMSLPTPDIFGHSTFQASNHFRLSTSQVPTLSDSWMGYGPVCPDGYGASYNPHPDTIVFCLSALNSCEGTSTLDFGRNLERALDDMKTLLDSRHGGGK